MLLPDSLSTIRERGDVLIFSGPQGESSRFCWQGHLLKRKTEDQQELTWKAYENLITNSAWQTVDIVFQQKSNSLQSGHPATNGIDKGYTAFSSPLAQDFLHAVFQAILTGTDSGTRVAKLIIPLVPGQIVRSDIIPLRLIDTEFVDGRYSLASPRQIFDGQRPKGSDLTNLSCLLSLSAGAVLLKGPPPGLVDIDVRSLSFFVEAELENRLSLPWIVKPVEVKTLALVEGCRVHPRDGGTAASVYPTAQALGIKLVVIDSPGHWLEGDEYAHWREAFLPLHLPQPADSGFAGRIAQALSLYKGKLDGIITFCDSYQPHVAAAAAQLGLVYSSPEALRIATDKYETSVFEGRQSHLFSSAREALAIASKHGDSLYPSILKPCNGWSSEGVFRIENRSELLQALPSVEKLGASRHGRQFVMEKYCSGPEVDVNVVILDGEILFFETCDDFPKSGDSGDSLSRGGGFQSFLEQSSAFPSALPLSELNLLKVCFHNTLLRLGIRNGVLHLEGRVDNSSMEYRKENGLLDLYHRSSSGPSSEPPASAWLIEINPRPPGMTAAEIIKSTYGVDYWGLGMLIALQDKERAKALAQPFLNGPQYTCVMVFISPEYDVQRCEGIFDSGDICTDLVSRRPELAAYISRSACFVKKGQKVAHPSTGVNTFIAYFNVFSRRSRQEALRMAEEVRDSVRYKFK